MRKKLSLAAVAAIAAWAIAACSPVSVIATMVEGVAYAETGKGLTAQAVDWLDERTCLVEYMRDRTPRAGCDHEVVRPIDDPMREH